MKKLAILNPFSDVPRTVSGLETVLTKIEDLGAKYELIQYPGHAEELARSASDVHDFIVLGGDGTVFEVMKGMNLRKQRLALLPGGTGNSLARDLNLRTFRDGLDAIQNEQHLRIDVNELHVIPAAAPSWTCYSASTIGIGYPAGTTRLGNRYFKALKTLCYPLAALVKTAFQPRLSLSLSYNDEPGEWKSLTGLLINNTRHSGNFEAFPAASCRDGVFNVMEMKASCVQQNLHNLSVLSRKHFYCPARQRCARLLRIVFATPQWLMVDGELFPEIREVTVKALPAALQCYGEI